jgi:hypothetical protein
MFPDESNATARGSLRPLIVGVVAVPLVVYESKVPENSCETRILLAAPTLASVVIADVTEGADAENVAVTEAPVYATVTDVAGPVTDVVDSVVAPEVSLSDRVIGVVYDPGPTITFPSASSAVTVSGMVAAVPAEGAEFESASAIELTTPFSVSGTVFAVPATTVAVVDAVESGLPVRLDGVEDDCAAS